MTDEQIKQAAIQRGCIEGTAEYYGFIEGARSRDWEVERLETELAVLENKCDSLESLLAKAQNPWRDPKVDVPYNGNIEIEFEDNDGNKWIGYFGREQRLFKPYGASWRTVENVTRWRVFLPKGGEV